MSKLKKDILTEEPNEKINVLTLTIDFEKNTVLTEGYTNLIGILACIEALQKVYNDELGKHETEDGSDV